MVWIGTSWKMNKTIAEACEYVTELSSLPIAPGVRAFLLPAHTALAAVRDCLGPSSRVLLGAQNAHWAPEGAGTGEVSMRMIKDAGAQVVEIGHSERREMFGESDQTVALKARAALDHGLIPLICVGEPLRVPRAGQAASFVAAQLTDAMAFVSSIEVARVLVAYEPVWAIGSAGQPAEPGEVAPIMSILADVVGRLSATGRCRGMLYGGGVDDTNAAEFLRNPHTNGLFVGRAAWTAQGMRRLLEIGAECASRLRWPTAGKQA